MTTHTDETPTGAIARRNFLHSLWKILGLLAFVEVIGLLVAFLWPRKRQVSEGEFGGIFNAGPVEGFALGSVTAYQRGRFYLVRIDDGGFLALSRKCTHLGCTVPWVADKNRFVCPCHASVFDITGEVVGPPAGRALDRFAVTIENGIVKVNTGKLLKRMRFEASQIVRP